MRSPKHQIVHILDLVKLVKKKDKAMNKSDLLNPQVCCPFVNKSCLMSLCDGAEDTP